MTNIHIVNHTHWDREWYFTSMDCIVLSDQLFTDVLEELKRQPNATFVLDGQLSILDDYLELYPEKLPEIKELVAKGQLFIGPWYTQTDAFFASGESILRNAMVGVFESKKYGEHLPIGYLPDTFGFNAQMPTILNEAGFDNIIFWRGIDLGEHVQSPYFKWKSLSGENKLYAVNFPQGYGAQQQLEPTKSYVEGRLDKGIDFIKSYADETDILIPTGNDQLGIISSLEEKIEKINEIGKYNYQTSTYQEFMRLVRQKDLEEYQGEFRAPVFARVHKTIGSVRMDLKREIFRLENKLTLEIEPMLVIAKELGIVLSNRLVMKAWKKLFECQAHDSLAGCVSDSVAQDIAHRLKEVSEICDSIENLVLKRISEGLQLTDQQFLILNTSATPFKGKKVVKLISKGNQIEVLGHESSVISMDYVPSRQNIMEETPAGNRFIEEPGYYILQVEVACSFDGLGYQVFDFVEQTSVDLPEMNPWTTLTKGKYSLSFEKGQLVFSDGKQTIQNFLTVIEDSNAGDTYDYSPIPNDHPFALTFDSCKGTEDTLVLEGKLELPYTLEERIKGQSTTNFAYQLTLRLTEQGEVLGALSFENTVLNHRVRIKTKLSQPIEKVVSAIQFGYLEKTNRSMTDWEQKYSEMPVNIEPFEKQVIAYSPEEALVFYTEQSKEYEYIDDSLYVTVLATTDSLGKPDLMYRPGRASGDTTKKGHIMMDTPLAQMENQLIDFTFSIRLESADISENTLVTWKTEKEQPSISYQLQDLNYFVYRIDNKIQSRIQPLVLSEQTYTQFSLTLEEGLSVSAIHHAYYTEGTVIRFVNATKEARSLDPEKLFAGYGYTRINALEEEVEDTKMISCYGLASYLLTK
ncbi:glycoside hydrolase family 38 C-terminal domain-containing protein [Candidatus Enterococcus mangumiae]|uniref:Glycoside hydrolase family 38 central domain-containing protein n=1 Tax=Candidatus Enterococcus mangumiae TaxID=2230878 RepID=A0ABZ2SZK6_9ENTE|nr:glycoside hydrolase family 38 C-terminal domain-containing protein [Enterococcus sp. DIV1094]MBO0491048.1 alpha-mannosidase [Enterococcus sp. DIV1094]